ncbi:MAG TPA: hypothetical protein PLQ43_04355, partial [Deltaproteobacteria bacterium]|nr:hypothetical protein [Deltaproteobacteria bacterium]
MRIAAKDPVQRRIEFIAYTLWALASVAGLSLSGADFALGVFLGGLVCIANYHLLWRHARSSV